MISTLTSTDTLDSKLLKLETQIGNTPLLKIEGFHENKNVQIFAKLEWKQLSGSVKARAAYNIIKNAILEHKITPDKTLLDASSGNTGIAYATIGKELGLKVTILLPENASTERKQILKSLGAEIIYTSKFGGTDEAQDAAKDLAYRNSEKFFYADQYSNDNNWKAHYNGTAIEIINEKPEITHFVAGLGTTGTFVGTSRKLKEYNPEIKTIALQPDFALHALEGWKHLETVTIPKIYDKSIADGIIEVNTLISHQYIAKFYEYYGFPISPSSAANIAGAVHLSKQIEKGTIITVLPDNADKYGDLIKKII